MPAQKPGRSKQDYQTPPEFIRAVKHLLGVEAFGLDLAASQENTQANHFWSEADNALGLDWYVLEGWNWLNPPYANITPWVKKAAEADRKIAVLVPASVGSGWWHDWVFRRSFILYLRPRISFIGADGPYPKDLALLLYGILPKGDAAWNWRTDVHTLS